MIKQSLYKKIQEVLPICCVDLIIKNGKGEFLLVKRKNRPAKGQWWVVGGRVKKGETLERAALRKAKEEVGLNVILEKQLGAKETIFKKGIFGENIHTINVIFLANIKGKKKIKLDSQSTDYRWFKKIKTNWHAYLKKVLESAEFK
ncbi:MAG TPA: NUDIX domain-containing protein [bacterium]|nr:NUDIX domain-containing protein [bacterium]